MSADKTTYAEFLIRRLHSLTGLAPLAVFLGFHLFANSYSTKSGGAFNSIVDSLRGMPYLPFIEWGLLLSPFIFHMVAGVWIIVTGQPNILRQNRPRNWAYVAQRVTAVVVFVFIIYHVVTMKYVYLDSTPMDYYEILRAKFATPWIYWWYVIGIACAAFHLANGLCTFCMTWGITVTRQSQRLTAAALAAAGMILFAIGLTALNGFTHG